MYQRESDGRWTATLSLGYGIEGKRRRRVVYGATKQEVLEKLAKLRAESSLAGNLPDAGNLTVGQLLDQWLAATKSKTAAGTYEGRESLVRVHIGPRIGGLKLTKLNTLHVESLYTEMARDGVKPWAARSPRGTLKHRPELRGADEAHQQQSRRECRETADDAAEHAVPDRPAGEGNDNRGAVVERLRTGRRRSRVGVPVG